MLQQHHKCVSLSHSGISGKSMPQLGGVQACHAAHALPNECIQTAQALQDVTSIQLDVILARQGVCFYIFQIPSSIIYTTLCRSKEYVLIHVKSLTSALLRR